MPGVAHQFESYGVHYVLTIGSMVPASAWRDALPPGSKLIARPRKVASKRYCVERKAAGFSLEVDGLEHVCATARALSDVLEGDLALHVAAFAPAHVFIHAGVVVWKGRALLLPGRTMSGKSTLVARLLAEGATYYSDEYAVLDASGLVLPYPRRMSLRRRRALPLRVLVPRPGRRRVAVGWVVGAHYLGPKTPLALESLSPGRTALLLLDNAVAARLASARVLRTLQRVVAAAEGYVGSRGDAREAAQHLLLRCKRRRAVVAKTSSGRIKK